MTKASEKLNLEREVVDDVVNFFYKTLHRKLANLEYFSVTAPGLGTFHLRRLKLNKKLINYEKAYESRNSEDLTMSEFKILKDFKTEIERLRTVQQLHDEELVRKAEKKASKANYKKMKDESNRNLEE